MHISNPGLFFQSLQWAETPLIPEGKTKDKETKYYGPSFIQHKLWITMWIKFPQRDCSPIDAAFYFNSLLFQYFIFIII